VVEETVPGHEPLQQHKWEVFCRYKIRQEIVEQGGRDRRVRRRELMNLDIGGSQLNPKGKKVIKKQKTKLWNSFSRLTYPDIPLSVPVNGPTFASLSPLRCQEVIIGKKRIGAPNSLDPSQPGEQRSVDSPMVRSA